MKAARHNGFSVVELLVIVLVLVLIVAFLLPAISHQKAAWRMECRNNLKQIGIGFKTWALDSYDNYHFQRPAKQGGTLEAFAAGDSYRHFLWMSNQLATPKAVVCPADVRKPAKTFTNSFSNVNVSYFVGQDANDNFPQMLLSGDRNLTNGPLRPNRILELTTNSVVGWTEKMHNREGNILLGDGSVQQFSTSGLRAYLLKDGLFNGTNRLSLP